MIIEGFQSARGPEEKAAIIAEATFGMLSESTALAARRCVLLHWFDLFLIESLLGDTELTLDDIKEIYEQLKELPFIEEVPWGLAFQSVTREGLINRYSDTHPELLQTAASLAAPAHEAREEEKRSIAEAFFCYTVAAEQEAAVELQQTLFEKASSQHDWPFLDNLFSLQKEAEHLPFVQPLPANEQDCLLRGFVHRIQGHSSLALFDYDQALELNSQSTLAYVSRGAVYAEQGEYEEALSNYERAIRIDRKCAPAYLNRGIVYNKQGKYEAAFKENGEAIQLGMKTDLVFINKGDILRALGNYEEALEAYATALRFNQDSVEALIGRGQTLNDLGIGYYEEALQTFEHVLSLHPDAVHAYVGKGQALNGLENYTEALQICRSVLELNPTPVEVYRVLAQALRGLHQYAEASEALKKAQELDPHLIQEVSLGDESKEQALHKQKQIFPVGGQNGSVSLWKAPKVLYSRKGNQQSVPRYLWHGINRSLAAACVGVFILVVVILFSATHVGTIGGGGGADATATARAIATASPKTSSRLEMQYHRITLTIDVSGILSNSPQAVTSVEQQLRAQSILQGRKVGLAFVYDGASTDADIATAQRIGGKIDTILKQLGQQSFAFDLASYYPPLYRLGNLPTTVIVDVYLFSTSSNAALFPRLSAAYKRISLTVSPVGILSDSQTATNNVEQQLRAQSILQGQEVGLAIVYGGAPTNADTNQALTISGNIYNILRQLGLQGFAFSRSAYYDPLVTLGVSLSEVTIDVFLFV